MLYTSHDRVVRYWDQRALAKEVYSIDTHEVAPIKNIDIDYQHS